jgi:hypothetical protein
MSAFIAAKSDQLNADDLMDAPRTITITKVTAAPDAAEQPVSIHYEGGENRPWKPCKTMRRILVGVWGKDASKYVGRSLTLYRDPTVAFGGMQVGGIRVSHMSHMDGEKTVALQVTRGRKAPFKVLPLKTKVQPADDLSVALKAITDAADEGLDALANVWKQKWMAPHRDALQVDLDRLKVIAAAKGKQSEPDQPAPPAEQSPEVNDKAATFNLGDEIDRDDHPAKPKADAIIAEINDPATNAEMDVTAILARYESDIAAMPPEIGASIEVAADQRRQAIRAQRESAKEGAE